MRVAYVVSSAGRDFYSAMTRVSVASLRMTNPGVRVRLVCDAVSATAMHAAGDPLLDEVDDLLVCETPPGEMVLAVSRKRCQRNFPCRRASCSGALHSKQQMRLGKQHDIGRNEGVTQAKGTR